MTPMQLATNYKADGPLGGFLAGLGDSFSLANADRDLADRDFRAQMERDKHGEYMADGPLRAVDRANKLAEAERTAADNTSGRAQELHDAERATKLQEAISKKSVAEVQNMEAQARTMMAMNEAFGPDDPPDFVQGQARWDQVRAIGEKTGIKMPAQYSPDALAKLRMGSKVAMNTIPYLQQNALLTRQQDFQADQSALNRASAEGIAAGNNAATIESARLRGEASTAPKDLTGKEAALRMYVELERKIKAGEPITQDEIDRYRGISGDKDDKEAKLFKDYADRFYNELRQNPERRKELATRFGDSTMTASEVAQRLARVRAAEEAESGDLMKFNGALVVDNSGKPLYRISGGEKVPVEGPAAPAPAPKAGGAAPSPRTGTRPPPAAAAPQEPIPPEANQAAFGVYPNAGGKTAASAAKAVDKKGNPAPLSERDVSTLGAAANRSMETDEARVRMIGKEFMDGVDPSNRKKELERLKKEGKIQTAQRGKQYQPGDVVITNTGKLAVYNGRGFDPI